MSRFDYVKYDEDSQVLQLAVKTVSQALENIIEQNLKHGRYKSLALTSLEETYAWIGKAIRDDQIERNGNAPLQEERKNG